MPKDLVCGKEIVEADACASSVQNMYGAAEVDPKQGTRSFHDGMLFYFCGLDCRT